jgi:hypothetical protein
MLGTHAKVYLDMQQVQLLTHEYPADHPWLPAWKNYFEQIHFVEDWRDVKNDMLFITGSDIGNRWVRECMNRHQPALYIGRGYCGNHTAKHRRLWRVSTNGWANIRLLPVPHSRWEVMQLPRHPWKVKQIKNVLIAPSKMANLSWSQENSQQWAERISSQFPGANVKIRYKPGKSGLRYATLWDDLDWADLVVTAASAITCEALWYGKKVISIEPCPTWAAGRATLDDWQNPQEPPFRDAWHEHLAWNQFTVDEWTSGEAFKLIDQYIGSIANYDPGYTYNLL